MIFHKRDPINESIMHWRWFVKTLFFIAYVGIITNTFSGTYTNSSFTVVKDGIKDSSLDFNGTLQLAIEHFTGVKIYGDSILPLYPLAMCPDVIAASKDTFSVFYMDTANNAVKKLDITNIGGTPTSLPTAKVMDANTTNNCYLHADKGKTGYLVSIVNKAQDNQLALRVGNGTSFKDCDTTISKSGWMFLSQCHMESDTFLVVYSIDATSIKLMKLFSSGSVIDVIDIITVSNDVSESLKLLNCSVVSDKKGGILVLWTRGVPVGDKTIYYRFYSRDLSAIQGGVLTDNVGDKIFYYYDDSPAAALDSLKFAVVHWDGNGVVMDILGMNEGSLSRATSRIVNSTDVKFATISTDSNGCIVAYLRDTTNSESVGIEGIHYDLEDGVLTNPSHYQLSDPGNLKLKDKYHIVVNTAINSARLFASVWRYSDRVQGAIWAELGVRYRNGFWISDAESLSVNNGDSIRFHPATMNVINSVSWDINSFIRTGASSNECTNSSWVSLVDDNALLQNRSVNRYFQYKIQVKRNSIGDSINTPSISSITIPYNIQPHITSADSIKTGNGTFKSMISGDTIHVFSRSDSVRLKITVYDHDPSEVLYLKTSWPGNGLFEQLSGTVPLKASVFLSAANRDTVAQCTVSVRDSRGWYAKPLVLNYKSRNALPDLTVSGIINYAAGSADTVTIIDNQHFFIQETDSLQLLYSVSDINDTGRVMGYIFNVHENGFSKLDSTGEDGAGWFQLRGDTLTPSFHHQYQIAAIDNDTSSPLNIYVHVNHSPVIRSVIVDGTILGSGDTAHTKISKMITIEVSVHDTDCYFGDTLTYRLVLPDTTISIKSHHESASFQWIPSQTDSVITVVVNDRYGKADSMFFFQKYPWFESDRQIFSDYSDALDTLSKMISLIISSGQGDTVLLPVFNNGSDTLTIESVRVQNKSSKWFSLGIPYDTGTYSTNGASEEIFDTLNIAPGTKRVFQCFFTADSLSGDSILSDTIAIITNDYSHSSMSIPVRLEYNDLPRIVSINPDFSASNPWHLSKRKASESVFPPHASICIQFSEPMDTVSMQRGLTIYSRRDSIAGRAEEPIRTRREWSQNYTKCYCFASYDKPSAAFSLFPPESLFIPTDNLAIRLNGNVTDRASTPSGPNALDINMDFKRNSASDDTTVTMNVDSIYFSVLSISPIPYDTQVKVKPVITLTFSSGVYSASVDKSLKANKTLIVRSRYNDGEQLDFDSISVDKNKVSFSIARKLFYCDSLWCRYNASSIKNSLGFQSDNNDDGIAVSMFDTSDSSDDLFWFYRIKNIHIVSHTPEKDDIIKEISPAVTIHFDDVIDESVIDTDTSNNNMSFNIVSMYESGFCSYKTITILNSGTTVEIQPARKFFSRDSIHFTFNGFSRNYRYKNSSNLPGVDSLENFDRLTWSFYTGNTGFYTFPNPYKPGKDPRHCNAHGPCGIWFKNLHVLKKGVNDLIVKVYSMNTHPVYNSQKAGDVIHFEENSARYLPQWLWDTRNTKGELVASGLYFYTVSDLKNKVLTKGKIMIVR